MGGNIDVLEVYPFVELAQSIYIQDLLGTPLYNDLCYKVYLGGTASLSSNSNLSTNEVTLIEMCSYALAYWAVYESIPHLTIKLRNAGLTRVQGDNIQQSTMEEMRFIRNDVKDKAEFFAQRVVKYLCENSTLFPLYNAQSDDIYPSGGQYDSDLYLDPYGMGDLSEREREFLKKFYYNR